ncbi:MAG: hypothetical protein Q9180_003910, partial [Flavoplaca navasiana]
MAALYNAGNPQPLNAQDLTRSPLPQILWNPERTTHSSTSPHRYVGLMAKWDSFEKEVRQNFHRQAWGTARRTLTWNPDPINSDRVTCATEVGITGRFLQHVGQVMSRVGHELNLPLCFGDWKGKRQDIPDVTVWVEGQTTQAARIAGEMKTPWTCPLGPLMSDTHPDRPTDRDDFEGKFTRWA